MDLRIRYGGAYGKRMDWGESWSRKTILFPLYSKAQANQGISTVISSLRQAGALSQKGWDWPTPQVRKNTLTFESLLFPHSWSSGLDTIVLLCYFDCQRRVLAPQKPGESIFDKSNWGKLILGEEPLCLYNTFLISSNNFYNQSL